MAVKQALRRRAVTRVEADLGALNGVAFEQVSVAVLDLLEPQCLEHRGQNQEGNPIGYTIDAFSLNGRVIAEAGSEAGYFKPPFSKLQDDLAHAKALHPAADRAYFVAKERCPPKQWRAVLALVRRLWPECDCRVLDGQALAGRLVRVVVERGHDPGILYDLLPSVAALRDEYVFQAATPSRPSGYVELVRQIDAITAGFTASSHVLLHGMSGAGKTYASIAWAEAEAARFDAVLWLLGTDVANEVRLEALELKRFGASMNVAARLRTSRTLLVVDDLRGSPARLVEAFEQVAAEGSRLLITCQVVHDDPANWVECPAPDRRGVEMLLTRDIGDLVPPQVLDTVIKATGGLPLAVSMLNRAIATTDLDWSGLPDELDHLPRFEDDRGRTLVLRLLERHARSIEFELCALKWLGGIEIEQALLRVVVGYTGVEKLKRRSLAGIDDRGTLALHELVAAAVAQWQGPTSHEGEIEERFWRYFQENVELAPHHFRRALQSESRRLGEGASGPNATGLQLRLWLLLDGVDATSAKVRGISSRPLATALGDRHLAVAIVEAKEILHRAEVGDARVGSAKNAALELESAAAECSDPHLRRTLIHHAGKFWARAQEVQRAAQRYREVLAERGEQHTTRLQLARAVVRRQPGEAAQLIGGILEDFRARPGSVPIAVVLAAFEELRRVELRVLRNEWVDRDPSLLALAVSLGCADGYSQPYRALAGLAGTLGYLAPEVLAELVEQLTPPAADTLPPRDAFDVGHLYMRMAKAATYEGDDSAARTWTELAGRYFDRRLAAGGPVSGFEAGRIAWCRQLLRDFRGALQILEAGDDDNCHTWHQRSECYAGLGEQAEAMEAIERAIGLNSDERFRATFLRVKARLLRATGDLNNALATLQEAHAHATSDKFREQLGHELEQLKSQLLS